MTEKSADATIERDKNLVQDQVDEENAQGFRGLNPDPTPNHHYSFDGAAKGLPTPETDPHMAAMTGKAVLQHPGHALQAALKDGKAKEK